METMSREELIAMFGLEAGEEIYKQQQAANSTGGSKEPFPLLKKVVDADLGLGKFGSFVFGVEYAKDRDDNGDKVVENKGINVGDTFKFVTVSVAYRFKRWVEGAGKDKKGQTQWSNIFTDMQGFKTAVDYNGNAIPDTKEARQALGWKTVKIMAGLVEADGKWYPVLFEADGKLYATLNNVLAKAPAKGLLDSIVTIVTKTEKQGSTKFTVVDEDKSTIDTNVLSVISANKDVVSDIAVKMMKYVKDNDYKASKNTAPAEQASTVSDDNNW